MTTDIATRLNRAEAVIEAGLNTFVQVGAALMSIRDARLYRVEYDTFEDYCRERWGMSRQRAHQMIEAAEITEAVSTIVDAAPATESQARELTGLDPETAAEVMDIAAESGKVTAASIREARNVVTGVATITTKTIEHVDTDTGEILTRAEAVARFPVLDVPGASDLDVATIAEQVLTHPEPRQDYRAEQGAKWLAAQVRKQDQPRDEHAVPIAYSHFHRLAEDVVLLDRHAASMAESYRAADAFRREQWAGAVDSLLDRLTALSVQMSSSANLRSVK